MRRAVNAGTASKRALDQHVLALQRSVERSYSQGFMIFNVRLSCNFVFMQRIHLEIRFSVFAVKFSRSETFQLRTRPLPKERVRDKTYFYNNELKKLQQLKLHDFKKLNRIAPVVHCSAIDSKLQSFITSRQFMKQTTVTADGFWTWAHGLTLSRRRHRCFFVGCCITLCFSRCEEL